MNDPQRDAADAARDQRGFCIALDDTDFAVFVAELKTAHDDGADDAQLPPLKRRHDQLVD